MFVGCSDFELWTAEAADAREVTPGVHKSREMENNECVRKGQSGARGGNPIENTEKHGKS